jgi:hypothetical protein
LGLAMMGANAQIISYPPVVFPNGTAVGGAVDMNRSITGAFVIQPGYRGYRDGPPLAITPNGLYALDGPGISYNYVIENGNTPIQYDVYDENSNANNDYASANRQIGYYRPSRVPHDRDHIQAKRLKNGEIQLNWKGDPRIVAGIRFALLDRNGKALKQTTVTRLPGAAQFTRPRTAVYYGAMIYYIDGKTNTFLSRI